jgi:hypothetical protein|nr:MAG TPA: hypothetical protein [Caudoviricetes sp.]
MKQPSKNAKAQLSEILSGEKEIVAIKGTKHYVRIGTIKNGTLEKLTSLWSKRDMSKRPEGVNDTMAIAVDDIYFNHKEAAYIVLNSFWKIKLFHWIVWRWFAFVWQLDETQLSDILSVGKKKIPLLSYYENIVLTLDMRTDMVRMTKKEAEEYRREVISAQERLSAQSSQSSAAHAGGSAE